MSDNASILLFALVAGAFLAGFYVERWRARFARQKWKAKQQKASVLAFRDKPAHASAPTDSADQLRLVMAAEFKPRRLLSKSEAQVFFAAEKAIEQANHPWRVMAQVSLGEILSCEDSRAYSTINSKRVDMLVITNSGDPVAAIEYQGSGHYQGSAPARDAVKKEALRRAGIRYIEITPEHGPEDVARELSRIARVARPAASR